MVFGLAAPAAAHVSAAAGDDGYGSGRTGATVAALVALAGVVIGALALRRAAGLASTRAGTGFARNGALAALGVGLAGIVLAAVHLANSSGGVGTGNGRAGAMVAIVIGLVAMALGALALTRSRRTAAAPSASSADRSG
jgi:hypothetical protein